MKLICPSCGAVHSAGAWQNDEIARQCLKLVGGMQHDISKSCLAYLSLFRKQGGALQWKKVYRLLVELSDNCNAPQICWKNQPARQNSARAWGLALERLLDNPPMRLPLKSHGYLRSIAYEIADEMDRQVEVKRNQAERNGTFRRKEGAIADPEKISFEEMKKITEENYRNRKK